MGIVVYSLLWEMQDLYHQPKYHAIATVVVTIATTIGTITVVHQHVAGMMMMMVLMVLMMVVNDRR